MTRAPVAPAHVEAYIRSFASDVQAILRKLRRLMLDAAPGAEEVISYRMPALKVNGVLVYYAAFKGHIGLYPPISGDDRLEKAVAPYANDKGNLRFPYDQPIPYDLIVRIVKLRVKQDAANAAAKRSKARS